MRKTNNKRYQALVHQVMGAFSKHLTVILLITGGAFVNLATAADQATQSWLMSNNAASFTYTGSQPGLGTGTVFTLSTSGNSLGFCTLTPTPNSNPQQYSTSCYTDYGNILGSGNSYSAVAFLGSQNNPTASFIVGDSSGKLSIATPNFQPANNSQPNSNYVVTGLNMTALPACPQGTAVANLATDPLGSYVYIGCYSAMANPIVVSPSFSPLAKNVYNLPGYTLYAAPVTSNGTTVSVGPYALQGGGFGSIFSAPGNSSQVSNQIAAVWPGVSTVMRTYPAGYPGLQPFNYASTGGVLVSGLIDQVIAGSGTASTGPLIIGNAAFMCSAGNCGLVNSSASSATGQYAQIITAFEIGMDAYQPNVYVPALYSSSFTLANNQIWYANYNPVTSAVDGYYGTIYWKNVFPTIYSCAISQSTGIGCGNTGQTLSWPPNGMQSAGNGYQIDITNLTYVPVPLGNTSPFTAGLLMIGTWNNGYLAYHSPANSNTSTGLFLNQVNGGIIGNVDSITADSNGNVMFQAGSQGLYAMNPFVGTNTATGTDTTLIQQPADSSNSGGGNWLGDLTNGAEFVYYTLQTIKFLATANAVLPNSAVVAPKRDQERSAKQVDLTPRYSLIGPFNLKNYRGQFVYTQSQLASLGLNPGDVIQGLRFRNEEGKTSAPVRNLNLRGMKITLSKPASNSEIPELKPQFAKNSGNNRKIVRSGPLTLFQGGLPSTGIHPDQGVGTGVYGQLIPFRSPYIYEGGNLLVDIESSGKTYNELVNVDAFGTQLNQGLYQTPKTKRPIPLKSVPALEFVE